MNALAILALKVYRMSLSPLLYACGVRCRHEPTCSIFAIEAYRRFPFLKATRLTADRLSRCRPGGTSGFDPVPPA